MVHTNAPGVDWQAVRERRESGEPAAAIARSYAAEGVQISKQAISKRAKKEGWAVPAVTLRPPATESPEAAPEPESIEATPPKPRQPKRKTAQPAAEEETSKAVVPTAPKLPADFMGKRTDETRAAIVESIKQGTNYSIAARRAGLTREELSLWLADDPKLAREVAAEQGEFAAEMIQQIADCARRGDWRAASYLLTRLDSTRDEYGDKPSGGQAIQININIERAAGPPPESEIIDVTPAA